MITVTLLKGFTHLGKELKIGDQFEGDSVEIASLVRQGFCNPAPELDLLLPFQPGQIWATLPLGEPPTGPPLIPWGTQYIQQK